MDLWVVAAATGAGYLAKYWRNLSFREREGLLESNSDDVIQWQVKGQTDPFHRLAVKQLKGGDGFLEKNRFKGDEEIGVVSSDSDCNVLSMASSLQGWGRIEGFRGIGDGAKGSEEFLEEFDGLGSEFMVGSRKLRSRTEGNFIRPVKAIVGKMEEYVFSSVSSQSTLTVRPLLVTDGRKEIGTLSRDFRGEVRFGSVEDEFHKGGDFGENEIPLGVSQKFGSTELPRKRKQSIGSRSSKRLSDYHGKVSGGPFHSQGSANGILFFLLGITIGMISIAVANKREVDKLNELLEKNENLVHDLDEELEMKDLPGVKELYRGGFEMLGTNKISFVKEEPKDPEDENTEKVEFMSKIEAELEAELERLELNMKTSNIGRIYDDIEGELRPDKFNVKPGAASDSELDASESTTNHTHNANYAVSPKELSLRLHEVIQSRLEARLIELETELENSRKNVQSLASQSIIISQRVLQSEENSTFRDEGHEINQPLVMNLSGEALDAYNEAYEEICRMVETDERTKQHATSNSESSEKEMLFQGLSGVDGRFNPQCEIMNGSWSRDITTWEEETSMSWGSNGIKSEDDDEMEKLLIKQIVEKARQGSLYLKF